MNLVCFDVGKSYVVKQLIRWINNAWLLDTHCTCCVWMEEYRPLHYI